ncbi:hypothetical protein HGRIS_011423 [Hohenbuehelia grisea]|uniref:GRIP domain-containing protein n=1 Tax=Hohenbuehelia grisea TaxID=104357 RepID=A0ABR3JX92_9AGAR
MTTNGQDSKPADPRTSLDSERSSQPSPIKPNGSSKGNSTNGATGHASDDDHVDSDDVETLRGQLKRAREDKETLATQYNNLLAKLTTMRSTLGKKLKEDAEELDRREQLLQELTARNEDLSNTVETLRDELVTSAEDADRFSRELDAARSRAVQDSAHEVMRRERELRETQTELERCRLERDEWERTAEQGKVVLEEAKTALEEFRRDLEIETEAREQAEAALEAEKEQVTNLQAVLQDFQTAKDHELRQAVKDYEAQLLQTTQSLAEYKSRALTAELTLEETQNNSTRIQELEKEVKDKTILNNKLRHEAVIMNEHLMEALRRLRRNASDTNVDRRLVTNVLLSFLTTPRADAKRFEMLGLLATVLSWTDTEREKAGLQRTQPSAAAGGSFWSRGSSAAAPKAELEKTDETESFSRLWVEFLLTEANGGESPPLPQRNNSLPGSPTVGVHPLSPSAKSNNTRRLASYSSAAMASSPTLALSQPPSRKGKEKASDTLGVP